MVRMVELSDRLVTVFGGSGFVGRHVVRALAKRGYRVRVAVRRPDLARFLMTAGAVGQIHGVQANLRYPESIERRRRGRRRRRQPRRHPAASAAATASTPCRPSARAPSPAPRGGRRAALRPGVGDRRRAALRPADYARTKAEGEEAARGAFPDTVILRPSIVFGPEDAVLQPLRRHGPHLARPCR